MEATARPTGPQPLSHQFFVETIYYGYTKNITLNVTNLQIDIFQFR